MRVLKSPNMKPPSFIFGDYLGQGCDSSVYPNRHRVVCRDLRLATCNAFAALPQESLGEHKAICDKRTGNPLGARQSLCQGRGALCNALGFLSPPSPDNTAALFGRVCVCVACTTSVFFGGELSWLSGRRFWGVPAINTALMYYSCLVNQRRIHVFHFGFGENATPQINSCLPKSTLVFDEWPNDGFLFVLTLPPPVCIARRSSPASRC